MNAQLNVHITKYHSSKAAEYERIYQGCDFVVSADYASQLESERDALKSRAFSLQRLLDQRWEMMRELEEVCETKDLEKAVEYVKGLKTRVKRLEEALGSIQEYWNRDNNEGAMQDACWHAINTASDALEAKESKP